MPSLQSGIHTIGEIDRLGMLDSPVHRRDARAKVVATLVFLVCVVSFGRYEVLQLLPFALFPVALAAEGRVPLGFLASRLLVAAPFALLVGAFNPVLDHAAVTLGGLTLAAGWVSYLSIVLRFLLTAAAGLVLVATAGFGPVCAALERLGLPDVLATQLLLLYRYLFVLVGEALRMERARDLRSFRGRGRGRHVYGGMLGQLLLRTFARAGRLYGAMLARGFDGHVRTLRRTAWTSADSAFVVAWSAAFVLFRSVDVPLAVGRIVTGAFL